MFYVDREIFSLFKSHHCGCEWDYPADVYSDSARQEDFSLPFFVLLLYFLMPELFHGFLVESKFLQDEVWFKV